MRGVTRDEVRRLIAAVDYSEPLTITAGEGDAREACREARRWGFRAVVAFPQYLPVLVEALAGSSVRAQVPVGFPCGGHTTETKCAEARQGLEAGATDLDMMINLSALKAGRTDEVAGQIDAVLALARQYEVPMKVIIETGALTDEEKRTAARLVADAGADYVKTCTGFGPGRATVHDIALIREAVGDRCGIKASGGVASLEDGVALMRAGADIVALRRMIVDQLEEAGWPEAEGPTHA